MELPEKAAAKNFEGYTVEPCMENVQKWDKLVFERQREGILNTVSCDMTVVFILKRETEKRARSPSSWEGAWVKERCFKRDEVGPTGEARLMPSLRPNASWCKVWCLLPSSHILGGTPCWETGWNELWSEDVRAHVPAALVLSFPVTTTVDMQGLSRDGIINPLEPQCLVTVLMCAWRNKKKRSVLPKWKPWGTWDEG